MAVVAAGVLGYHPYSEDGGIYLAEIKRGLDPQLYPLETAFVAGHLGWSGFTAGVVWMVRGLGWRVEWVMAGLHMLCVWGVLVGVSLLAGRCYGDARARWGAVGLVALCLTMPVAGTSLLLMDPYVTARSVCLALTLPGMAGVAGFVVDRETGLRWGRLGWGVGALTAACVVHPLMGGYGTGAVLVLVGVLDERRWVRVGGVLSVGAAAVIVAGVGQTLGARESAEYVRVAATRYYWFLSQWRWFELVGLAAPLGILGWVGWGRWSGRLEGGLARMAVWVGGFAVGIALVFAREGGRVHAVARMQPLRCFQVVYAVMLMVAGGWLGGRVLRSSAWRWGFAALVIAGAMLYVQRETYPASGHVELPGMRVRNGWEQAFLWVRGDTPKDALFGLDADYVQRAGEDAQGFRAAAERSALPDYSKDGGQAAIRPELTEAWTVGQRAQARLTEETDEARLRALKPLGVTWVVMGREGVTGFACLYENAVVKVCRLP